MPSPRRPSRWLLKPLDQPHLPRHLEPVSGEWTVGRDPVNGVVVQGSDFPQVSGHHARFSMRRERMVVEDLGSTNGTLVNGRAVDSRVLASGDTVQLGPGGPRFVVLDAGSVRDAVGGGGSSELGATQFVQPKGMLEAHSPRKGPRFTALEVRRSFAISAALLGILGIGVTMGFVHLKRSGEDGLERVEAVSRQIQERLEGELIEANHRLEHQSELWSQQRADLARERDELQARIASIEEGGGVSPESLEGLRRELEETQRHLELYDPVALEESRIAEVARVRSAVVLIEKKVVYRDPASGKLLHLSENGDGVDPLSLGGAGEPLTLDSSTGSGFCVSPEGWILTNAHVLRFSGRRFPVQLEADVELVAERQLEVVFTDRVERHRAEVVRIAADDDTDLALLKIEPFEGMPSLDGIDLEQGPPDPGSEVYLFGFPLGHHALQEGDRVVASTFKGILSRVVQPYLQVDAGVYPGNSGGPLTDSHGRVIGVIFSVQNNLDGTTAANIGYAIPASSLGAVWPPPETGAAPLAQGAEPAR